MTDVSMNLSEGPRHEDKPVAIQDTVEHKLVAPEFPHLVPAAWDMATRGRRERIAAARSDLVIRHPAVMVADTYAQWMLDGPCRTRTTGMLVLGPVGAGKTTLATMIWRRYRSHEGAREVPIVMISLTGARNMRTVYGRILDALSGPVRASHSTTDREMAAIRLLRVVRCRALIVDEVQDVLAGSQVEQGHVLNALKFLMNQLALPIFAFGVPAADASFKSDMHMDARFKRYWLPAWSADDALASLLKSVEQRLPLHRPSQLCTKVAMDLLVKKSEGSLDGIMTMVRHAAVQAILTGEERITYRLLEAAQDIPDMEAIANVQD